MYDAAGNVLAEGSVELGSQNDYTEKNISFNYGANAGKAARIYICFLSTVVENSLKKDKNWITPPPFGDLGRGEWAGSTLYIDDVTLNY